MSDVTATYLCHFLGSGTGTAKLGLAPMLDSWARDVKANLVAGTLNLCAQVAVTPPEPGISLRSYAHLAPAWAQIEDGFSPRLYPVLLNEHQAAWLYRWSDSSHLRNFVGDADGCAAEFRCEIIAEEHLTTVLGLTAGDEVSLRFVLAR